MIYPRLYYERVCSDSDSIRDVHRTFVYVFCHTPVTKPYREWQVPARILKQDGQVKRHR
jgi:S-adenosylmethionine:diacylglycerol 3-amino-3-carboxypropyl transferase